MLIGLASRGEAGKAYLRDGLEVTRVHFYGWVSRRGAGWIQNKRRTFKVQDIIQNLAIAMKNQGIGGPTILTVFIIFKPCSSA
jgi:ABC-type uncharacterized transport system ATPase subunit